MEKFKTPNYHFDFIDGLLLVNGKITLSRKIPAKDVPNRIINTFHTNPGTIGSGIFILDINGWVGNHIVD